MTRVRARLCFAVMLSCFGPDAAVSQEAVQAEPGSVITAPVPVPRALLPAGADGGRRSLSFGIEAGPDVLVIGPMSGTFTWEAGDPLLFPVTLRLPRDVEAGPMAGLTVAFADSSGRTSSVPIGIDVRTVRALRVELVADEAGVVRGHDAGFRFAIANDGNVGDSVHIVVDATGSRPTGVPSTLWLEAFETVEGSFSIPIPSESPVGAEEYVRLTVRASGVRAADHATVLVLPDEGLFPDMVQVPTTVFLGSTVTAADGDARTQPVLSVDGRGTVGPSTDLFFSYRLHPRGSNAYAFRGLFSTPGLLFGVRRPEWEVTAGDLTPRLSDILGYTHQSRGARGLWHRGRVALGVLAGRPLGTNGGVVDGHALALEGGLRHGAVRTDLVLSSTERADLLGRPESAVRTGLVRLSGGHANHSFGVEAGPMRIENLSSEETASGPAVNARYTYRARGTSLDLRARTLPDLAADPRLPASQLRAAGTRPLGGRLSARASLFNEAAARSSFLEGSRILGGEAGLRYGRPAWSAGMAIVGREVRGRVDGSRFGLRLDGAIRLGSVAFDGAMSVGRSRLAEIAEPATKIRLGTSWRDGRGYVNLNLTYANDLLQPASVLIDASGAYQVSGRVEVYGAASSFSDILVDGIPTRTITESISVRSGARVRLGSGLLVYSGIERLATGLGGGGEWRFSAGFQQGVPLPLPIRRTPVVSGLVYEDENGDGRRDASEPLLEGVSLRMGFERAVTGPGGRFEFRTAEPGVIDVDTPALGPGYLEMGGILVPPERQMEIAVVRSAALRVALFLDEDGNGEWDDEELPASGARIVLTRNGDEAWELRSEDDGRVTVGSVAPGTFVISVSAEGLPRRATPPALRSVELRGGEEVDVLVAVPVERIRFTRFGEDGRPCGEDAAPCSEDE